MKKIIFITTTIFLLIIFSCKKERNQTVVIVRDCTGTYLRWEGKDYQVCNLEKVSSFSGGKKVTATFKRVKECSTSTKDPVFCYMLHTNEGWIEVDKIK